MRTRRLIALPFLVLAAILLVGAVIDAGQRTRLPASVGATTWRPATVELLIERQRLEGIERSAVTCVGRVECAPTRSASRYEQAARQVEAARPDPRLDGVRSAVADVLRKRADLARIVVAVDADGRRTNAEQRRVEQVEQHVRRAAATAIDAHYAAGLIDEIRRDGMQAQLDARH